MNFDQALRLLKKLEPFDLEAAERPIALWDLDGMAELARRVDIPIMADESAATEHDLINVIRRRAATAVRTKQSKNGGIWKVTACGRWPRLQACASIRETIPA